jgi:hypothetical protein
MKVTKTLYKPSIIEMILISLVLLTLLNGLALLIYTFIFKISFSTLFAKTWIILLLIPLTQGIFQALVNRNGLLKIESTDKSLILFSKIKELLNQKGYKEIEQNTMNSLFEYRTLWKMIINMNRGKVKILHNEGIVEVFGKRNLLHQIETMVKFDKEINASQ